MMEEMMEVSRVQQGRRRWSGDEKVVMVRQSFEPGKTVLMVAVQHGVNPNQLSTWRKLYKTGRLSTVSDGEQVVPASELNEALKQIKALKRLLGKKSWEYEILKETVRVMKSRRC